MKQMPEDEAKKHPAPLGVTPEALEVWRAMLALSEFERAEISRCFCECGSTDLQCRCWDDE